MEKERSGEMGKKPLTLEIWFLFLTQVVPQTSKWNEWYEDGLQGQSSFICCEIYPKRMSKHLARYP